MGLASRERDWLRLLLFIVVGLCCCWNEEPLRVCATHGCSRGVKLDQLIRRFDEHMTDRGESKYKKEFSLLGDEKSLIAV